MLCDTNFYLKKKTLGLKIAAGDNPVLCVDLLLSQSNSRVGYRVLCEHKYLVKHDKQWRGGEDLEKKYQTGGNMRGECFSENLRHCQERVSTLLFGRTLEITFLFLERT